MKCLALLMLPFLFYSCLEHKKKAKLLEPIEQKDTLAALPEGAIIADFQGNGTYYYGYVKTVDIAKETTSISFQDEIYPTLTIPQSIGAQLQVLKLKNFDRDLLLVNAKLKDTNFNEYYLFRLKDSVWKPIVDRFDIFKGNMVDTLVPIQSNPTDSTHLLRYYSVFDIDRTSGEKYKWRLLRESVEIED